MSGFFQNKSAQEYILLKPLEMYYYGPFSFTSKKTV